MNAVAIRQPQSMVAADHNATDMFKMAQAIAAGKLFGSTDPNAVFTLMLLAQAEGKHPGLVMRDYHVISGKPAKKADAMLVDFLASGGKVEWHSLTDELADATFTHPAGGSVRISWDDKRVQAAGIGSNPMHKKYPRQMKRARVISEGVRTVYPGATGGLYVPEEVQDFDEPMMRTAKPVERPQIERAKAATPFDRPDVTPAMAEEAAGHVPHGEPAEVAAAGSEAALFDEPDYVEQAATLDARYRACSDLDSLRQLWSDTSDDRRAIISADATYKDVFAKVLEREKARLAGGVE